jgi:hypothetical protein
VTNDDKQSICNVLVSDVIYPPPGLEDDPGYRAIVAATMRRIRQAHRYAETISKSRCLRAIQISKTPLIKILN